MSLFGGVTRAVHYGVDGWRPACGDPGRVDTTVLRDRVTCVRCRGTRRFADEWYEPQPLETKPVPGRRAATPGNDHPYGGVIPAAVSWAYDEAAIPGEVNVDRNPVTGEIEVWVDDPASHKAFLAGRAERPCRVNVRLSPVQAALLTGQLWLAMSEGMDQ